MIERVDRTDWKIAGAGAAGAVALGAAAAAAPFHSLILVGLVVAAPAAIWLLGSPSRAIVLLLGVLALLPRFASPVSIGFKPTFLDVAVLGLLVTWLLTRRERRDARVHTPVEGPIVALMVTAVGAFVVGIPNGALTTLVIRRFGELMLSLLLILALTRALRERPDRATLFVRTAMLLGAASASIGLVLYVLPDETTIRLLSTLAVFDYPSGPEVIHFIRQDPELAQRATGLWIDPNAFGGYLLLTAALCLPQTMTARPAAPRWLAWACVGLMGAALAATVSRGAMLGLLLAATALGVVRYPRLLGLGALVVAAALVLPQTRDLVGHFVDGFLGNDLATQMRFGEYKDALRLIERYPVLGVGFTGSPDVDLYVGVSSMYLLILQQMGVMGLTAFVSLIAVLAVGAVRAWPHVRAAGDQRAEAIFLGAHAAVLGALFAGIFDHYFFNIDFHNSVTWMCALLALAAATQSHQPAGRPGCGK